MNPKYPFFRAYLGGEKIYDKYESKDGYYAYCHYVKDGKWKIIDVQTNKESPAEYDVCRFLYGDENEEAYDDTEAAYVYNITGTLDNGQIVIEASSKSSEFILNLDNVSVTSSICGLD